MPEAFCVLYKADDVPARRYPPLQKLNEPVEVDKKVSRMTHLSCPESHWCWWHLHVKLQRPKPHEECHILQHPFCYGLLLFRLPFVSNLPCKYWSVVMPLLPVVDM